MRSNYVIDLVPVIVIVITRHAGGGGGAFCCYVRVVGKNRLCLTWGGKTPKFLSNYHEDC